MRKHITLRNVPADLARALDAAKRMTGESLNRTVLAILRQALGLEPGRAFDNGLRKLAGTWGEPEFRRFEKNTLLFEQVDEELWR
jgi:hypothetical protein